MSGSARSTNQPARTAAVEATTSSDAVLLSVSGLVDERFEGFGPVDRVKTAVIDVSGITRMTSFGVRQWLKGIDALPKTITDLYLYGCPTFFVDQLNMVLNFGGAAKVLTVVAPYTCPGCGTECGELIDVVAERAALRTQAPERDCARCGAKLELDETPESYFAFAAKYAASNIHPAAAQLLASRGRYTPAPATSEKPPRTIKLVHGSVTYYRIIGTIGSLFRARPFVIGAEGEIVIDLAEVEHFDVSGVNEWRRLLKTLAGQVSSVTLVDVGEALLSAAGNTFTLARNIAVASLLAPYECVECERTSFVSENLTTMVWPPTFEERVCATCGGSTRCKLSLEVLSPLQKASTSPPSASIKIVESRQELLSRALTDASVAQAGGAASPASNTILGKYKIVRRLSGGGMADVFLAKQIGIGGFEKPVALKRIQNKMLEDRQQAIELFLNEAKIAGRLTHPNIVQVLDVGEVGGALYLAMEYVHGKDLREVVKALQKDGSNVRLADACYIVREVALALDHAYWSTDLQGKRLNVVHRDVSPHNVILGYDGTVKLLDFGVAMSAITETAEKLIVGKWTYMAPETTLKSVADHRSDLFSLGVVLYLLACGAIPFSGTSPKEIVTKIRSGDYKPVTEAAPGVPERLATLIGRMLAPNADLRPQRGQEVAAELGEIMRENQLESSPQRVAQLLMGIFPDSSARAATSNELVRVYRDEIGPSDDTRIQTLPNVERASVTPSAGTGHRPIDMSHSFRRTSSIQSARSLPTAIQVAQNAPGAQTRGRLINWLLMLAIFGLMGGLVYVFLNSV